MVFRIFFLEKLIALRNVAIQFYKSASFSKVIFKSLWGKFCLRTTLRGTCWYLQNVIAFLVAFFFYNRQTSSNKGSSTFRTILCPLVHAVHAKKICALRASDRFLDKNLAYGTLKIRVWHLWSLYLDSLIYVTFY